MEYIFVEGERLKNSLMLAAKEFNVSQGNIGYEILKENEVLGTLLIKAWDKNQAPKDYGGFKIRIKSRGVEIFCPESEEPYEEQYKKLDLLLVSRGVNVSKDLSESEFIEKNLNRWVLLKEDISLIDSNPSENLKIQYDHDEIFAYLTVKKPEFRERTCEAEEIYAFLDEHFITTGVNEEWIKKIDEEEACGIFLIAVGGFSQEGKDARIELKWREIETISYLQKFRKEKQKFSLPGPNTQFYAVQNVIEGDIVGKFFPLTEGHNGLTVKGKEVIETPGKDLNIIVGNYIKYDQELNVYVALRSGNLCFDGKKIWIEIDLTIKESIGVRTGCVLFVGNIIVNGDIHENFFIQGLNISIAGSLSSGAVVFASGNVEVKGINNAFVYAKQDIVGAFAENSVLKAEGNISIIDSIIRCDVTSGQGVLCYKGKGSILGGDIRARDVVLCKKLGSQGYVRTSLVLGWKYHFITLYEDVKLKFDKTMQSFQKIKLITMKLRKRIEALGKNEDEKKSIYLKKQQQLQWMQNKMKVKLKKMEQFFDEQVSLAKEESNKDAEIIVGQEVYPKTALRISGIELINDLEKGSTRFILSRDRRTIDASNLAVEHLEKYVKKYMRET